MFYNLKKSINKTLVKLTGYQIRKVNKKVDYLKDEPYLDKEFLKICDKIEKIYKHNCVTETNYTAFITTKNIINQNLQGCFVECGVFKGEKISIFLETLKYLNVKNRNIYLIDTFEGMTEPSELDYQVVDGSKMNKNDMLGTIKEVKKNIINTDYPLDNIKFVKIDVRSTEKLKNSIQENIALLRLDTDFYDSTISILDALYDQVNKNGYIIHDDYGHWKGHYEACKKFFETRKINPVLVRTCRKERLQIKV